MRTLNSSPELEPETEAGIAGLSLSPFGKLCQPIVVAPAAADVVAAATQRQLAIFQ